MLFFLLYAIPCMTNVFRHMLPKAVFCFFTVSSHAILLPVIVQQDVCVNATQIIYVLDIYERIHAVINSDKTQIALQSREDYELLTQYFWIICTGKGLP